MAYAKATDVTTLWAREPDEEVVHLIERRLEQVERMIRRRIPDLDERVEDDDYLADVVDIEADVVLRLVRNPEGYISETDGQYTYQLNADLAAGRLEILPHEWEILGAPLRSGMAVLVPRVIMPT
ncbi:head-tail adaptor Ad1 [Mycobacterium phage Phlei]|uniref:Head-to-tail adaptor n=1 Tax=Mycobacterium phage Phlei TaxID=1690684 RepID=A0A0N9BDP8_9CAUD|nr:head-tail adaptor Ad1 [Mycobacterium phage Phlei]ALA48126.1 hypothetical protein [Mycobacterium phage Phlei]